MQLLDDAVERIKPYLVERLDRGTPMDGDFYYRGKDDYGYFRGTARTATIARLRLDWEELLVEQTSHEDTVNGMMDFMKDDLADLIENGDVLEYADPLLKVIDGSKKRGKEATHVDIFNAILFWEPKPRKGTTEYTLYLLMAVQWS